MIPRAYMKLRQIQLLKVRAATRRERERHEAAQAWAAQAAREINDALRGDADAVAPAWGADGKPPLNS